MASNLAWAALAAPFAFQYLFGGQKQTNYNPPPVRVTKKYRKVKKIKKDLSRAKLAHPLPGIKPHPKPTHYPLYKQLSDIRAFNDVYKQLS